MPGISHQCLCNYNNESAENRFYKLSAKGGTIACACAFPTKDSRGAAACEKAVTVSVDSFMRRPAVIDVAMDAISGFVNEAVYALQEPQKRFLCSAAILFIHKGQYRCILSGNAQLWHFCNGKLIKCFSAEDAPLFGVSLKRKFSAAAAESLPKGENAFMLYSGYEPSGFDTAMVEAALNGSQSAESWLEKISGDDRKSSLFAAVIPQKTNVFNRLFSRK